MDHSSEEPQRGGSSKAKETNRGVVLRLESIAFGFNEGLHPTIDSQGTEARASWPGQTKSQGRLANRSPTHVLEAAHEVVADRRARQVGCVGAAPNVEEVIRAQHGVILLRVACGGQDSVHRDGHLPSPRRGRDRRQPASTPWEEPQAGKGGTRGQWGRGTPIFMSACLEGRTVGLERRKREEETAQDLMVSVWVTARPARSMAQALLVRV